MVLNAGTLASHVTPNLVRGARDYVRALGNTLAGGRVPNEARSPTRNCCSANTLAANSIPYVVCWAIAG